MTDPAAVEYVTPAQIARALKLRDSTADPRLAPLCTAVSDSIDAWCHRTERMDPVPPQVTEVAIAWAVESYKQPDAAFQVVGMSDTGAVRIRRDSGERFTAALMPYTLGWGIG